MMRNGDDSFYKVEQFLLRIALLVLLVIGLLKVIAPEVKSLTTYFRGQQEASTIEH